MVVIRNSSLVALVFGVVLFTVLALLAYTISCVDVSRFSEYTVQKFLFWSSGTDGVLITYGAVGYVLTH